MVITILVVPEAIYTRYTVSYTHLDVYKRQIMQMFEQFPVTEAVLVVLVLAMIAFYASTFDAITLVVAGYSEKDMGQKEEPRKRLRCLLYTSIHFQRQ